MRVTDGELEISTEGFLVLTGTKFSSSLENVYLLVRKVLNETICGTCTHLLKYIIEILSYF